MKKLLMICGGSLLLLGCLVFGALFAGPLMAFASSTGSSPTPTTQNNASQNQPYCNAFEQDLAKRLNVSVTTLQQDRAGAYTDVLNQLVKDGKLTQNEANTLIQHAQNNTKCKGFRADKVEKHARAAIFKKYENDINTQVAQGLHLSLAQLQQQVQSGKSLVEVAKAQGVSETSLHTLIQNAFNSALDKASSAGDITSTQATQYKQFVQKHPVALQHLVHHELKGNKKSHTQSTSK